MRSIQYSRALLRGSRIASRVVASPSEVAARRPLQRPFAAQLARDGSLATQRLFSQQTPLQAKKDRNKGGKADPGVNNKSSHKKSASPNTAASEDATSSSDGRPKPNPEEPFDLSDLEYGWTRGAERFEEELRRMRGGDRFNAEAIGAVRVRPDKRSGETFPLHELAAVVPRPGGRSISVLVHEAGFVKPVMSAIQSSPEFNQQPQRSEDNELELLLRVEPERKDALVKRAKETCHAWREQIRAERHKRDVVVKKWAKDGVITANDKTRLDKELQKLQDKRMAVVDGREKDILQNIASRDGR